MDKLIYNVLCQYYKTLEKLGYYSYGDVYPLLVLVFYWNFVYNDYRGLISYSDYRLIEKALNCIYGKSCLTPYPDYLKMGKLHLGEITEIGERLRALEDTEVIKPYPKGEVDSESDIIIIQEEEEE
jgi:hypothetical protein